MTCHSGPSFFASGVSVHAFVRFRSAPASNKSRNNVAFLLVGGDEERRRAVLPGVRIGAPFEQDARGFHLILRHGVLERGPAAVIEIGKDESERGGGEAFRSSRSRPACGWRATSPVRAAHTRCPCGSVPEIVGRGAEDPAGRTDGRRRTAGRCGNSCRRQ